MKILFGIFLCLLPLFSFAHEEESSVLISITSKGFEPSSLKIAPHTKVVFINRDAEGHWPASDRHPTHSDYSGTDLETHCSESYDGPVPFDSCGPIKAGETWSFVFEEAGTFNYHDHVWSHLDGTIIVRTERQPLRIEIWISSLIKWAKSFFVVDIDTLENELITLVESDNPKVAIDTLREKSHNNAKLYAVCHDLTHEIGRASLSKYKDLKTTLSFQNDYCNSGYIHGVFEEYFMTNKIEYDSLASLCEGATRPFDEWQCFHGIGHGLMYQTGGDILATIDICKNSLNSSAASQCQNGAYMELFNNEILLHEPSFIISESPLKTCESMTISQADCYLYVPTYFIQNLNWSYEDTIDSCMNLEKPSRLSCINGTAAEAAKRSQHSLNETFSLCERFKSGDELTACIKGISTVNVFQTASIEVALKACSKSGKYIERCRFFVDNIKPLFISTY